MQDESMTLGLDDLAADLGIDLGDEDEKPKVRRKPAKRVKKKPAPKPEPEDDQDDDLDDDLMALLDDDPEPAKKPTVKKPRAKAKSKPKAAPEPEDDDLSELLEDSTEREAVKAATGIDIASECPVCRKMNGKCKCEEDDRTFFRRTRFENGDKTARCPRCKAPLSSVYVPRPGAKKPFRLPQFTVVWGCVPCHGDALATTMLNAHR